ncbi:MAG: hypothetical protein JWN93_243 [Hyphomicrobiales bacterium]|jgi:hypothetical protein|nr:hypothetical protein [Hyphomicrobiales bacterium]
MKTQAATSAPAALLEAAPEAAKPFWASQTIWSSLAVVGSSAAGALFAWKSGDMSAFGAAITALLGGVNAIVGRWRAVTPIG